jgi:hypothetical protein
MVRPRCGSCSDSARRRAHGTIKGQKSKGLCTNKASQFTRQILRTGTGETNRQGNTSERTAPCAATTAIAQTGLYDSACRLQGLAAAGPVHLWGSNRRTTHAALRLSVPAGAKAQVWTCGVEAERRDHQQYAESQTQQPLPNLASVLQEEQSWQVPQQRTRFALFPTQYSLKHASELKMEEQKDQGKYKSGAPRDAPGLKSKCFPDGRERRNLAFWELDGKEYTSYLLFVFRHRLTGR